MICVCDIIVLCVKELRGQLKVDHHSNFRHTKHIPKGHVVYSMVKQNTETRFFVSIEDEEPLHVTIGSCSDDDISVMVSFISDVTMPGQWSVEKVMTGRRSLAFTKKTARRGVYSFQLLVQARLGTRVRFLRTSTGVATLTPLRKSRAPVVFSSLRRAFSTRWRPVRASAPVSYCAYVNRTPRRIGAHCPPQSLTGQYLTGGQGKMSQGPVYCGLENSFTYSSAEPGMAYNVDVFAVNTQTGETYAYPSVKVNTKHRTREFQLNTRCPQRFLVPRDHNEHYMAFTQYRYTRGLVQLVATYNGVTSSRDHANSGFVVRLTLYKHGNQVAVSESTDGNGMMRLSAELGRGRYVIRASSNGSGRPYSLNLALGISDGDVAGVGGARWPRPPVVSLPADLVVRQSQDGGLRWSTAATSRFRPQRYCVYSYTSTSADILRGEELTSDLRKLGRRMHCSGEVTDARQLTWSYQGRGFRGRVVFAVYVVSSNRKLLQRRLNLLQVDI